MPRSSFVVEAPPMSPGEELRMAASQIRELPDDQQAIVKHQIREQLLGIQDVMLRTEVEMMLSSLVDIPEESEESCRS